MGARVKSVSDRTDEESICDEDRDSLHTLPISILPIQTRVFRRARLVKNAKLESVIEFFSAPGCGRGQLDIRDIEKFMSLEKVIGTHPDVELLNVVSELPSFDVYSLRIQLRAHNINLADESTLTLSASRMRALNTYMAAFTRPLIASVFGRDTTGEQFSNIVGLFRASNPETVRNRLDTMAQRLGISRDAIPQFLEDYGDIFMSLSYYRHCLDQLLPDISSFLDDLAAIRTNDQLARDRLLIGNVLAIESSINASMANITGKLESFQRSTDDMWRDISAERFQKIKSLISQYHTTIGGALCALTVKMGAWTREFPGKSGGSGRRAAFLMSDIRQGIERLQVGTNDAPLLSAIGR